MSDWHVLHLTLDEVQRAAMEFAARREGLEGAFRGNVSIEVSVNPEARTGKIVAGTVTMWRTDAGRAALAQRQGGE